MSRIYNHPHAEAGYCVGHVNSDGRVYNHPHADAGYCVGHIASDGRVYNHSHAEAGYCVGHIASDGRVYNHPHAEAGYCVGHIASDGRIYNHPHAEAGYCIGHAEKGCPIYYAGGALLLLLLNDAIPYVEPEGPNTSPDGGATSTRGNTFASSGTSSGFLGEFLIFSIILIAIAFAYMMIQAAPVILFLACTIITSITNGRYRKYVKENGSPSPQHIAQVKADSKSWTLSICAVLLAVDILFIVLESVYLAMYLMFLPIEYWMINTTVWKRMAMGDMRMRPLFGRVSNSKSTSHQTTKVPPKPQPQEPQQAKNTRSQQDQTYQRHRTNQFHHSDAISNYFSCPQCHTFLRVPKGKGRIQITCAKCKMRFNVDD